MYLQVELILEIIKMESLEEIMHLLPIPVYGMMKVDQMEKKGELNNNLAALLSAYQGIVTGVSLIAPAIVINLMGQYLS